MLPYHVSTQPHVHDRSSPWAPISVSAPPSYLRTPLVLKPCIFFDTRQSDYFTLLALSSLIAFPSFYFVFLTPTTSNPCPTIVQLPSDSGLQPLPQNYRTYLLIVQVGATHKLKPSPTCYPPPITHWPSPTQLWTSNSGLPLESTPNRQSRNGYRSSGGGAIKWTWGWVNTWYGSMRKMEQYDYQWHGDRKGSDGNE